VALGSLIVVAISELGFSTTTRFQLAMFCVTPCGAGMLVAGGGSQAP
jgi:hypothetical protein